MTLNNLTCLLFNDLESFERSSIEPIIEKLSDSTAIETIWVTEAQRRFFRKKIKGDFWVIARDWRRALDFLSLESFRDGRVFVSVLNTKQEEKRLYGLPFRTFLKSLPKSLNFIVHSPLEFHFFQNIKKVPLTQLKIAPLAMPAHLKPRPQRSSNKFEIGTFCDFSLESNINFLIGVAHFISKQTSQVHFNILGRGPLYAHFSQMINSLQLNDVVSIVETQSESSVGVLDLFLYAPLRNHHFIPVMLAGAYAVPVIATDLPGIQDFVSNEKTGFILPSYEAQVLGGKILEFLKNPSLGSTLGLALNQYLNQNFSHHFITQKYRDIFFGDASKVESLPTAA